MWYLDVVQTSESPLECIKLKYQYLHTRRLKSPVSYLQMQLCVAFHWTDWEGQHSWRNFLSKKEQVAIMLWCQKWKIIILIGALILWKMKKFETCFEHVRKILFELVISCNSANVGGICTQNIWNANTVLLHNNALTVKSSQYTILQ
jgi:hypothetical protein